MSYYWRNINKNFREKYYDKRSNYYTYTWSCSIRNEWDNFKKSFEKLGNTVINPILRYHQRGYKSDPKLGNTSILDYVEDIEKIIKKLQQKPIIIGYSMGGLIALIFALKVMVN